jgi:hypothetical protein
VTPTRFGGTRHVLFARQRIEGNEQIEVDACEPFGQGRFREHTLRRRRACMTAFMSPWKQGARFM